nr:immunoglobulin heavy chain junction region [Mus musculus]
CTRGWDGDYWYFDVW